jgi:hypothetical protein
MQVQKLVADVSVLREQQHHRLAAQAPGGQGKPEATAQLQDQLSKLTESTEKRNTRVETAIYQVRARAGTCNHKALSAGAKAGVKACCTAINEGQASYRLLQR